MAIKFEPIYAKIPDPNMLYNEIVKELRAEGEDTNKMFNRFFQTWSEKPVATFKVTMDRNKGYGDVYNYPQGDEGIIQIFRWLVYGTRPHIITPHGDYPLRFPSVFTPKTQPGVIASNPGGKDWNSPETRTYYVEHPGNAPRGTLAQIDQERRQRVLLRLQMATRRGIEKSMRAGKVVK